MAENAVPKCAVINDLSGFGRCSLTVAIPVLSAMGVQACPVPTAILSNHTGYEDFHFRDFTNDMETYFSKWKKLGLEFDSIYTGFLGDERQIELILKFVEEFCTRDTLLLVDPVMGDHGKRYATCNDRLCDEMRRLVARAHVITPNLTEACILTGQDYPENPCSERVFEIGEKLLELGSDCAVITGVRKKGKMVNFVLDKSGEPFAAESDFVACEYCGTGDLFASLMCGYMTLGIPCRVALERSADFLIKTISASYSLGVDPLDGVAFEKFLREIVI